MRTGLACCRSRCSIAVELCLPSSRPQRPLRPQRLAPMAAVLGQGLLIAGRLICQRVHRHSQPQAKCVAGWPLRAFVAALDDSHPAGDATGGSGCSDSANNCDIFIPTSVLSPALVQFQDGNRLPAVKMSP
ncbi:hypothetical protein C8Q73DRAFT_384962 [Cubamyces lactineus]|nr:hypothetical protein C8Q73DRAFT_384962 [Cubamyces lactineus]